ncbi:carbohydrate kinase family protein [Schaalia canis]|uniref:Carbohydrate kinase family protein n=1 Tax=Schaalia canis TaxID=100469 RepID=A0A3P1SF83_9ACTO|nr:carbohydrate kinase family protein [Schaalia canis]RRC95590.1 carbohydrate kinase family protein [Schaalia canis]
MTQVDVLVVGGVGVDQIVRVKSLPLPVVDSMMVPPIATVVGHTGNGVALGVHALSRSSAMVDVIGDDDEGRFIRDVYLATGISTNFVTHISGTRRSVILVTEEGQRMSLYDPRHPFEFTPDPSLWREGIKRSRHVHVSIMNWARYALQDAIAAGRSTSTDLHDWDGVADYHRDFAYGADYVFVSAAALTDESAVVADIFVRGRAQFVVVMAGSEGARVWQRSDEQPLRISPISIPDRPVVDSNGAGDSFVAAFLCHYLDHGDIAGAARAGAVGGAWACGSLGTHTSFVDTETLERLLAR